MPDDIKRAPTFFTPGVFTFISERPRFRQITQKCIESSGGASEKRYCVLQVMFHHAPQFVDSSFRETLIVSVLRRVRERPTLVMALWQQGELYRLYSQTGERRGQYCLYLSLGGAAGKAFAAGFTSKGALPLSLLVLERQGG